MKPILQAPLTRWHAAGIHLASSIVVIAIAAGLVVTLWYPPSLFHVSGADRLLLVLAVIDISAGPLLTLLIYRHRKPGLKFDLTVISLLQIAFFIYGAHVFWAGRPVFIVGSVDRFELVFASQVAPADLEKASSPYDRIGAGRPRLVGLQLPRDPDVRSELLLAEIAGHHSAHQPRFYRDYPEVAPQLMRRSRPVSELMRNPADSALLERVLQRLQRAPEQVRWLPLDSSRGAAVQLADPQSGKLLATLPIDPWSIPRQTK